MFSGNPSAIDNNTRATSSVVRGVREVVVVVVEGDESVCEYDEDVLSIGSLIALL